MSFYISISNIDSATTNIHLPTPINLINETWKVGLVEAFFPSKLPILNAKDRICLVFDGNRTHTYYTANNLYFDQLSTFITYIHEHCLARHNINMAYIDNRVIIKNEHPKAWVAFREKVAYMLGLEKNIKIKETTTSNLDLFAGVYNIYLYLNIISPQYVGNVRTNLLKTVFIDRTSDNTHVIIEKPYYLNISHTQLSTLTLDIRTLTGEKVIFPSGYINFTLHFKKITQNDK